MTVYHLVDETGECPVWAGEVELVGAESLHEVVLVHVGRLVDEVGDGADRGVGGHTELAADAAHHGLAPSGTEDYQICTVPAGSCALSQSTIAFVASSSRWTRKTFL